MTRIGRSDLDVFPLCLGANVFGWTADRDESFRILDAFHGGGGNFIDTADSYSAWVPGNSGGDSERIIGEWLASRRPENVIIATKVSQHPDFRGLAPNSSVSSASSTSSAKTDSPTARLAISSALISALVSAHLLTLRLLTSSSPHLLTS